MKEKCPIHPTINLGSCGFYTGKEHGWKPEQKDTKNEQQLDEQYLAGISTVLLDFGIKLPLRTVNRLMLQLGAVKQDEQI